ncbi:MAG: NitrOD5 domain-containing protein [Candidatus Bathyarchaeia archaeon]
MDEVYEKILQCVDTALKKFGENVSESIYYYLKKDFNLEKTEIPAKPEVFVKALTFIFGDQGAKIIEKQIITEIENNFQLKKDSFKETVSIIKKTSKLA